MNNLAVINNVSVEFSIVGDNVFTDTLKIAEVFEKRHTDVLRTIDNLPNDEFKSSNFKYDSYFDKKGEARPMYRLTRDGFSLLVMGFTGQKAYKWKIEFIKAFNEMEKTIKKQNEIIKLKSYEEKTKLKQQKTANFYEKRIAELLDECANKHKKAVDLAASLVLADEKQREINAEILNDFMDFQSKIYAKLKANYTWMS
ncbi:Rha family transcriptional regulator [Campylobacter hyointestinalis]|uniref:Rha family transcriptional regulator n=1 Tax=Campylobacter hyointestinalis TaxID=198 RepID=UPI000729F724|nr:Rha family transcriptional regulator [Campylobacter hyointestinalis]CUU71839.1 phage protein [Campylobacter hyointestinalis subsp. hyointestinalis]